MNTRLSIGSVSNYKLRGHEQSGAIMIVALVLLFVVTLLAMSGLKTASVQERMALNAQSTNTAFQHAESAVNSVLWRMQNNERSFIYDAYANGESSPEELNYGDTDTLTTVQVKYLGSFSGDGESLGKDIPQTRYEIVGVVRVQATGAHSTTTQGFNY